MMVSTFVTCPPVGVGVGLAVGEAVTVGVGLAVGEAVTVGVGLGVGVAWVRGFQ
jgi:hypothetical protein